MPISRLTDANLPLPAEKLLISQSLCGPIQDMDAKLPTGGAKGGKGGASKFETVDSLVDQIDDT